MVRDNEVASMTACQIGKNPRWIRPMDMHNVRSRTPDRCHHSRRYRSIGESSHGSGAVHQYSGSPFGDTPGIGIGDHYAYIGKLAQMSGELLQVRLHASGMWRIEFSNLQDSDTPEPRSVVKDQPKA